MALSLPRNAQRIIEMRQAGAVINGVWVSYVGRTDMLGPHVYCDSGQRYSWRFLEGIPCGLITRPGIDCLDAMDGLYRAGFPKWLPMLIDVERSIATHIVGQRELGMQWKEDSPQWHSIFPIRLLDQQDRRKEAAWRR